MSWHLRRDARGWHLTRRIGDTRPGTITLHGRRPWDLIASWRMARRWGEW